MAVKSLFESIFLIPPDGFIAVRQKNQITNTFTEARGYLLPKISFLNQSIAFDDIRLSLQPRGQEDLCFFQQILANMKKHIARRACWDEHLAVTICLDKTLDTRETRI